MHILRVLSVYSRGRGEEKKRDEFLVEETERELICRAVLSYIYIDSPQRGEEKEEE